jgi:hypothetical protein
MALNVPLPKPAILQPGEEERQLVQGYRDESAGLESRIAPIREQMGALGNEMSGITESMPRPPQLQPVPEFRGRQVDHGEMMTFASIATALAALGASMTRTGITGALNAAGGAIKGFNEGNIQQAKIDAENFQMTMRATIANNNRMLEEYSAVLNDRKLTLAQRMQQYSVLANKYQDEIAISALRKGDIRFELERMDKMRNAQNQLEVMFAKMEAQISGQLARVQAQQEPLVPVQNTDGTVRYVRRSQAEGAIVPPRNVGDKLTETEAKGTLFWRQMSSAEDAARTIAGPQFDVANLGSQIGIRMAQSDMTNWLAPENAQKYQQASEQWAEAYLRLKTGAATNADEIKRNARAYFPQPGDSPGTIIQKNQMRARAIQDVSIIAGRGTDKQPAAATPPGAPPGGGPSEGQRGVSKSGKPTIFRNGRWEYL